MRTRKKGRVERLAVSVDGDHPRVRDLSLVGQQVSPNVPKLLGLSLSIPSLFGGSAVPHGRSCGCVARSRRAPWQALPNAAPVQWLPVGSQTLQPGSSLVQSDLHAPDARAVLRRALPSGAPRGLRS